MRTYGKVDLLKPRDNTAETYDPYEDYGFSKTDFDSLTDFALQIEVASSNETLVSNSLFK